MGGDRHEGDRRASHGRGGDHDRVPLEIFPTSGATLFTPPEPLADGPHPTLGDQLRRGGSAVHHGIDYARDLRATPGPRPGRAVAATGARRGGGCDIVRPVQLHPERACALAFGELFTRPIDHLEIVDTSAAVDLVWRVVITGSRRVPATLHLLASPSMVVTVLELVPHRQLRWHRERFVRDGIAAADSLAQRLLDCA